MHAHCYDLGDGWVCVCVFASLQIKKEHQRALLVCTGFAFAMPAYVIFKIVRIFTTDLFGRVPVYLFLVSGAFGSGSARRSGRLQGLVRQD